jgi:multicomponent Na+:H+ antiporter subunit B
VSAAGRTALFWAGALGMAALFLAGFAGLPRYGHGHGPYGDTISRVATAERHATDAVAAVNFDYRALDTVGEEFILFASVVGVALILRRRPDEQQERGDRDRKAARAVPPTSAATRLLGVLLVNLTLTFGAYVVMHGQVSPGGGFQGGVVLATALLVVYLSTNVRTYLRAAPRWLVEAAEALGAGGFVALGLAGLAGGAYLANVLPLGQPGDVLSAGTILVANAAVGLEVAGGFVLLLSDFLEEAIERRYRGKS